MKILKTLLLTLILAIGGSVAAEAQDTPVKASFTMKDAYTQITKASVMIGAYSPSQKRSVMIGSGTICGFNKKTGEYFVITAYHCIDQLYKAAPDAGYFACILDTRRGVKRMVRIVTKQHKTPFYNPKTDVGFLAFKHQKGDDYEIVGLSRSVRPELADLVLVNPTAPYGLTVIRRAYIGALSPDKTLLCLDRHFTFGNSGAAVCKLDARGRPHIVGLVILVQVYNDGTRHPLPGYTIVIITV